VTGNYVGWLMPQLHELDNPALPITRGGTDHQRQPPRTRYLVTNGHQHATSQLDGPCARPDGRSTGPRLRMRGQQPSVEP
jgi:hypothetical protein